MNNPGYYKIKPPQDFYKKIVIKSFLLMTIFSMTND
jgi:hypothetical protein